MRVLRQWRSIVRACAFSAGCMLFWMGSACGGPSALPTVVCGTCEEPGRFVRLQTRSNQIVPAEAGGFSHPILLNPQEWKSILEGIRVRPLVGFFRKGDVEPAFTPEEIDYLGMTLSRAFAGASSREWVVFGLRNPDQTVVSKMTTGGWYVEGTRLHLLLPNFQAPVPMENLMEVLNQDPLFEVLGATRYEFFPNEYSANVSKQTSGLSHLWEETPHLAIEYQLLLAGGTGNKEAKETQDLEVEGTSTVKSEVGGLPSSGIGDRLAILKWLKERHLITEEDYQGKKKALLDQL